MFRKNNFEQYAKLNNLKDTLEKLLELSCEQLEDKKISVLMTEILAVQIYEKTAAIGGAKRPGFAFDQ